MKTLRDLRIRRDNSLTFISSKQFSITESSPLVLMAIHRIQIITQCVQYTKIYTITQIQKFKKEGGVKKKMGWSLGCIRTLNTRRMENRWWERRTDFQMLAGIIQLF